MKKKKSIGYIVNLTENVKPKYLSRKRRKHPLFVIIEIYRDNRYGAIANIYERNSVLDRYDETTSRAERKRISKKLSEIKGDDKPVDTFNWVKPDEETIRNALIECLFFLEIFKEDYWEWKERFGKASAYYSILHSYSPSNPQALMNFEFGQCGNTYFKSIMSEFKSIEHKKYWNQFSKDFKKKNKTKDHWKSRRKNYQIWKKECLSKMIILDYNPPIFNSPFKKIVTIL